MTSASSSQCGQNRVAVVGHDRAGDRLAAVARHEGGEHRPVGVGDPKAIRRRAHRQQFVARDENPHARSADDRRLAESE